jgi:hypothetical protein
LCLLGVSWVEFVWYKAEEYQHNLCEVSTLRYLAASNAHLGGPLSAVAAELKNGKEEDVTQAQRTATVEST